MHRGTLIPMSDRPDLEFPDDQDVDDHAAPVVVAVHSDRGEAEVSRAHLAGEGIVAEIVDAVEGGALPVDGEPGVAVAVRAVDADRARDVLGRNIP
jgi:hypothetical protein